MAKPAVVRVSIRFVLRLLSADGMLTGYESLRIFAKPYDLRDRVRAERARDAPSSPFAMVEYNPANRQAVAEKQEDAAELQKEARAAAENGELWVRNTLFLASALFFIGMSRMFTKNRVRQALVVLAAVLLLIGAVNSFAVPII